VRLSDLLDIDIDIERWLHEDDDDDDGAQRVKYKKRQWKVRWPDEILIRNIIKMN